MEKLVGLRREDKNIWERRVPLTPEHVKDLRENENINFIVQPFERRAFSADEFKNAGAVIDEDINKAPFIFAVKEIPINLLAENKVYMFFSHTIKGQSYNMPLLQKIIDLKDTLIDYEEIKDAQGRRLVFFGRFAGLAGMIDALHVYGERLKYFGYETPFLHVKPAYTYGDVNHAKEDVRKLADELKTSELPEQFAPYIIGFTGYGNVSKGAQEILDILPVIEIHPDEIQSVVDEKRKGIFKVVFKEENMVKPIDGSAKFELLDYYKHPEKYTPIFEDYLINLSLLVNAVYWDEKYPRIVSKKFLKENFHKMRLQLIQDISCDINGGVEITFKATEPDVPGYVYNPETDIFIDGHEGTGVVNLAVDNLPTEIPKDSSIAFGDALEPFVPGIVNADYEKSFSEINLPPEIKHAVVVYKGELTPNYTYLNEFLNKQ
jgi:alpha-aminoadipic semialdehyde synthase